MTCREDIDGILIAHPSVGYSSAVRLLWYSSAVRHTTAAYTRQRILTMKHNNDSPPKYEAYQDIWLEKWILHTLLLYWGPLENSHLVQDGGITQFNAFSTAFLTRGNRSAHREYPAGGFQPIKKHALFNFLSLVCALEFVSSRPPTLDMV